MKVAFCYLLMIALMIFLNVWYKSAPATHIVAINQQIEDPNGAALRNFNQSLSRTLAHRDGSENMKIPKIIHYGDSHVAADMFTAALRRSFQHTLGDGGAGFVLAGNPWSWYGR